MPLGIDFDHIAKKNMDRVWVMLKLDSDPIFTEGFKKIIHFIGYKLLPFILNIAGFIVLIQILMLIKNRAGMDTVFIVVAVILIFAIGDVSSKLKKLTGE